MINPYSYEHAARILPPSDFSFLRRKSVKNGTIGLIFGKRGNGPMKLQAVRFRAAFFTVAQARAWLKKHGLTPVKFETATRTKKAAWKQEGVRSKRKRSVLVNINGVLYRAIVRKIG